MQFVDLTNQIFNKLTVIRRTENTRSGMTRWLCRCECGNDTIVASKHLKSGRTKSCGCEIKSGHDHKQWTGFGEISGDLWNTIVRHSLSRGGVPIKIDKEYAWNLFKTQNGLCALSGVPIYFSKRNADKRTASLDRINSSLGYIPGNVQWVHKDVNKMKNQFDQSYFIDMCKNIARSN